MIEFCEIANRYDYVEILDGDDNATSPSLGRYCGSVV